MDAFAGRTAPRRRGEIIEWVGAAKDITARREADEALRRSEHRLRRILDTPGVGVIFFDHSGTVIDGNDEFYAMTGYSRERRDQRATAGRFAATVRIGPYVKEYRLHDGTLRWMLFAGRDFGDGTICEYCIDISDIQRDIEASDLASPTDESSLGRSSR